MSHHQVVSPVFPPRRCWPALLAGALTLLAFTASARADVPPPGFEACKTKQVGDACNLAVGHAGSGAAFPIAPGVCTKSTCLKLDYQNWDRDASAAPPSVQYDCLLCVDPRKVDGGTDTTSGTGGTSGSGGASATGGTSGSGGRPVDGGTPGGSGSSGGCSLGGAVAARDLGPWVMAGAVGLLVSLVRRRRRS